MRFDTRCAGKIRIRSTGIGDYGRIRAVALFPAQLPHFSERQPSSTCEGLYARPTGRRRVEGAREKATAPAVAAGAATRTQAAALAAAGVATVEIVFRICEAIW